MNRVESADLLGLRFAKLRAPETVDRCLEWAGAQSGSHVVITANASHLIMMRRDPELFRACVAGDLAVADGMSVVWALKAAGTPVPERVAGIDLMVQLLEAGAQRNLRVYFLGARPEVVSELIAVAGRRFPGLVVAGYRDGYFTAADHAAIVEDIRAAAPHFLFVGMPSPFKETWVEKHRGRLNVPVIVGVGGSFDVLAGFIRRAPRLVQKVGMEWAWRLVMEPRKLWKRYLTTNSEFIWLAGREILAKRRRAPEAATQS